MAEDAKKIGQEAKADEADAAATGDTFVERLVSWLDWIKTGDLLII